MFTGWVSIGTQAIASWSEVHPPTCCRSSLVDQLGSRYTIDHRRAGHVEILGDWRTAVTAGVNRILVRSWKNGASSFYPPVERTAPYMFILKFNLQVWRSQLRLCFTSQHRLSLCKWIGHICFFEVCGRWEFFTRHLKFYF